MSELRTAVRSSGRLRTTARQDLITSLLAAWITLGGTIDGFAHRNLTTPETFFTPWHAVLYAGYLTAAGWIVSLVFRNRPQASKFRRAIPAGYDTALLGVGVFALGGVGDGFWHTLFGIEVSVDALLSPTHLLLLIGSLLILSGPVRAAAGQADSRRLPVLISVTMAAIQIGFFFQYIDGFSNRFMETLYVPGSEEGYFEVVAGIASYLFTTLIVMGAVVYLIKGSRVAPGSFTFLFGIMGFAMEFLEGFEFPRDVVAPFGAGIAADILYRALRPVPQRLMALRFFVGAIPMVMWSIHLVVFAANGTIRWPVSVTSGIVVMSGLAAVGLSLLAFPTVSTADA